MKRSLAFFLALASVLSCTKEAMPEATKSIEVRLDGTATKTVLDGFKVYWTDGDRISANGIESAALSSVGQKVSAARFDLPESVSYPISILYPSSFYKDAQTITLPSLQNWTEGSFATATFPCAGVQTSAQEYSSLKNLCALIKLPLTSSHNHPVKGVIFKGGAGEQVCGDFTVDYSSGTMARAGGGAQLKLATGSLQLGTQATDLYFVIPPGQYNGFSFRIIDTENHFMDLSTKSAVELAAGAMYTIAGPVAFAPTGTLVDIGQGDFGATGAVVEKVGSAAEWNTFATDYNEGRFSAIDPSLFAVQLTADLDFTDRTFVTINSYSGGVEGCGHSFRNLTAAGPIFRAVSNASITNLHIDQSCAFSLAGGNDLGVIANVATGTTNVAECSIAGTVTSAGSAESFGGIFGSVAGTDCIIENCTGNATITSDALFAGGLVGTLESGVLMRYCTSRGAISGSGSVGGLVGRLLNSTMDDCTNYGTVACTSSDGRLGGMIGVTASDKCIITGGGNYGKLTGSCAKRGLLVGEFTSLSSMNGCFVGGSITGATITADNWKTDFVGYGYSAVSTRISNLTSSYAASTALTLKDAELRILFIGNSFTDDAVKHLPGMIRAAGLGSRITMAQMYYGGRIMQEYNDWTKADYTLYKFEAGDSGWTTHADKVSIADVVACGRWDIITMQEHTGNWHGWIWNSDEKSCFDGMFSKLNAAQSTTPKYWYIFSQAYFRMTNIGTGSRDYMTWPLENTRAAQLSMYSVISEFAGKVMENCPFDGILATGTMLQNLRTSELDNSMDLTRDGYHMDYGITRYGAACLLFESLVTPKFGVNLDSNTYRYSSSSTEDGKYSTPVTNDNAPIALAAARYAKAKPFEITDMTPERQPVTLQGAGTSASPYLISAAADMRQIANAVQPNATVYFKLTSDIDMSSIGDWLPSCPSDAGCIIDFEGDGHTISGFRCTDRTSTSLFGVLNGAVRNLNLSGCSVSSADICALLATNAGTSSPVSLHNVHAVNCSVASTLANGTVNTGGLVATIGRATVTSCSFSGTVSTKNKSAYSGFVGGLLGQVVSNSTVKRCFADVTVTGVSNNYRGGGLVGGSEANIAVTVSDCYTKGSMTAISYFGGVIGELSKGAAVRNCYSTMTLRADYAVGGVVGRACNHCNPNSSNTFNTDVDISVTGCIAWNPSITSTKKTSPASGYSSGAVVAFNVNKNTLASCVRRPDMTFDMYPVTEFNTLVDQPDSGPSSPYTKLSTETYYMPYHGRAASSGSTVSSVAADLGWNPSIWDFSTSEPTLRLVPADFNDTLVQ